METLALAAQLTATVTVLNEEIRLDDLLERVAVAKSLTLNRSSLPQIWLNVRLEDVSPERVAGAITAATGGRVVFGDDLSYREARRPSPYDKGAQEVNEALTASRRVLNLGYAYLKRRVDELEQRLLEYPRLLPRTDPVWLAEYKELKQLRPFTEPASYAFARTTKQVKSDRVQFIPARRAVKFLNEANGTTLESDSEPFFVIVNSGQLNLYLWRGSHAYPSYASLNSLYFSQDTAYTQLRTNRVGFLPTFRIQRWDSRLTLSQYWQLVSLSTGLPLVSIASRTGQRSVPVGKVSAIVKDGIILGSDPNSGYEWEPPSLTIQKGEFPTIEEYSRAVVKAKISASARVRDAYPSTTSVGVDPVVEAMTILGQLTDSELKALLVGKTLFVRNMGAHVKRAVIESLMCGQNFATDGVIRGLGVPELMRLDRFEMRLTKGESKNAKIWGSGEQVIETPYKLQITLPNSTWPAWKFGWMSKPR
ncbi:MAG: hypothetical protein ABL949_16445 [Fimbriimonadaceae bacterium]